MKDEAVFNRYNASALLGIHASISLTDSLIIFESGSRSSSEDHDDAVKLLKEICNRKGIDKEGIKKFKKILSKKIL